MRTFSRTLARTGVLQVDSVNVLQRAHYMPLFSRMGPYDTDLLRRASEQSPRRVVEYWAHVAGLHAGRPVARTCGTGWRVTASAATRGPGRRRQPELVDSLVSEIRDEGATTPRDLDDGLAATARSTGAGTGPRPQARPRLPLHLRRARHRRAQQPVRARLRPARAGASRRRSSTQPDADPARDQGRAGPAGRAQSHGVATVRCLRDYYRLQLERGEDTQVDHARDRGAGRGRRAAARADRGLEAPGLPAPGRRRCRARSTPGRC